MSSVGSPANDSRFYRHDCCCDRNTAAQPIQIEEKALSMNAFIVHQKERHLRPCVIAFTITMPLADPNGGIPALVWIIRKRCAMNLATATILFGNEVTDTP